MTGAVIHLDDRRPNSDKLAEGRYKASNDMEHIVGIPDGSNLTTTCEYLGISRSALNSVTKRFGDELRAVGYTPGIGRTESAMTRRAILHVAMLLRPNTSDVARELRRRMGVWTDKKPTIGDMSHIQSCRTALEKAMEIIASVRDIDPADLWADLGKMERWQLQAVVIGLASMVDDEATFRELTCYLTEISRVCRYDKKQANAAHGLSKLTQPRPDRKKK